MRLHDSRLHPRTRNVAGTAQVERELEASRRGRPKERVSRFGLADERVVFVECLMGLPRIPDAAEQERLIVTPPR